MVYTELLLAAASGLATLVQAHLFSLLKSCFHLVHKEKNVVLVEERFDVLNYYACKSCYNQSCIIHAAISHALFMLQSVMHYSCYNQSCIIHATISHALFMLQSVMHYSCYNQSCIIHATTSHALFMLQPVMHYSCYNQSCIIHATISHALFMLQPVMHYSCYNQSCIIHATISHALFMLQPVMHYSCYNQPCIIHPLHHEIHTSGPSHCTTHLYWQDHTCLREWGLTKEGLLCNIIKDHHVLCFLLGYPSKQKERITTS